ncbi:hypothetical protein QJQ45_005225 [Haematococcus lacustris]|nr:hypothetical protein QJQ45_005225 [Haematococcus lacustris]
MMIRQQMQPAQPQERRKPFVLGLTGSVGMGKTTVANMFRRLGVPVQDADEVVHQLYSQGGAAVEPVGRLFPSAVVNGGIDRSRLSGLVVGVPGALQQLEAAVHPLVAAQRDRFLLDAAEAGHPLVLLDIPLLFETQQHSQVSAVVVVSAPAPLQRARVLARGWSEEKLQAILAKQVPDEEKRRRATYVIDTGTSLADTEAQVEQLLATLQVKVAEEQERGT